MTWRELRDMIWQFEVVHGLCLDEYEIVFEYEDEYNYITFCPTVVEPLLGARSIAMYAE